MQRDELIRPLQNQLRERARLVGLDQCNDIHIHCDGADPPNILYVSVGRSVRGDLVEIEELLRTSSSAEDFTRRANEMGLCSLRD
jgi:hypothetical protein